MMKILLVISFLLGVAFGCNPNNCNGDCNCMSTNIPGGLSPENTPQLVMLTFDDSITVNNFEPTYKPLFMGANKNPSGCNIGATFFATHEYTNYAEVHHLWRAGNEIAVHTITHETSTDMWKHADYERWRDEAVGMRNMIAKYGRIPASDVKGFRSPFLQTAGNTTFRMLKEEGFLYDSSMPSRSHSAYVGYQPIWPFTLDHPFKMDCVIEPCPTGSYPGLWIVPLLSMFKERVVIPGRPPEMMPCAMADACLPFPATVDETYDYFMENFKRHYETNKAPFPLFLHEAWLKQENRKDGYLKFVDYLLSKDDIFIVTVQEVIEFIKNPKPLGEYKEQKCITTLPPAKCAATGKYCYFEMTELGGPRSFFTCTSTCPAGYPWLRTET